jgi:hypothetical protein
VAKELVKAGPEGVRAIVGLLVEPGKGNDAKARFALNGMAHYVGRAGADAEREMFAKTLAACLGEDYAPAVKGFVIRMLRLTGGKDSAAAISRSLASEDLCEYAAQALVSIGADPAPLLEALPNAKGKCRLTILQNLGVLRANAAVPELLKAAADADRPTRLVALYALGNIGAAAATDTLMKAADAEGPFERSQATRSLLLLAQRLAEAKDAAGAEKIYGHLWKTRTDPADSGPRCAALRGLVTVAGAKASDVIDEAMKSEDFRLRAVAKDLAVSIPGSEITLAWAGKLQGASAASRVFSPKPGISGQAAPASSRSCAAVNCAHHLAKCAPCAFASSSPRWS